MKKEIKYIVKKLQLINYYPKYAQNKTINFCRSYNNFYAFKFNLDKINNNNKSVKGNNEIMDEFEKFEDEFDE